MPYLPILYQSFWRDEAFSTLVAVHNPLQIVQLMMKDQSPPLYFLALHYWMLWFGTGEAPIRMLSYVFFLGTLLVTFLFSWKLLRTIPARLTLLGILYLNPFLMQYAYEARPYSMFAFLTVTAATCLVYNQLVLAGIFLALSLLSHNFAIFSVAAVFLWFVYERRTDLRTNSKRTLIDALLLFTIPAITFLLWSGAIFQQVARVSAAFWITEKTSAMYYYIFTSFTTGSIWFKQHDILLFFSGTLLILGAAPIIMGALKKDTLTSATRLTIALAILPIICTYIVSHFKTPIYYDRYLIASLPFVFVLLAQGIEYLWREGSLIWKIGLFCLLYGYALTLFTAYQTIQQTTTKPAINWGTAQALQRAKPGDMIISETDLNFLETKWYVQGNTKHIQAHVVSRDGTLPYYIGTAVVDPSDIIRALPKKTTVWVIQQDGGFHKEEVK